MYYLINCYINTSLDYYTTVDYKKSYNTKTGCIELAPVTILKIWIKTNKDIEELDEVFEEHIIQYLTRQYDKISIDSIDITKRQIEAPKMFVLDLN